MSTLVHARPPRPARRPRERGFALLITITLLAFLVLLLVSLASLTRVETQVSANSHQFEKARQQALFGLQVALGELQRHAGPDQRATARADLLAASNQDGSRHWTGVWAPANSAPGGSTIPDGPDSAFTSNPQPRLLTWLVSRNEAADAATIDTTPANGTGWITNTPAAPAVAPSPPVANLPASTTATDTNLLIGGQPATLLVGANTTGPTSAANYVAAPWRLVEVEESQIPGLNASSSAAVPVGRYAWWVGDEGVKARVYTEDPDYSAAQNSPEWTARVSSSPRAWIGAMTDIPATDFPANPSAPETAADFANALTHQQAKFTVPAIPPAAWLARYHDLSTHASGVLSDARRGGLREDLSYHRAHPPAATVELLPSSVLLSGAATENPTLQKLLSYAELDTATLPIPARLASATSQGIFPVIVSTTHVFGFTQDAAGRVFINYFPMVVLANPYNVPITGSYQIRFNHNNTTNLELARNTGPGTAIVQTLNIDIRRIVSTPLRIINETIDPGQARIYSLSISGAGFDADSLSYPFVPPAAAPASTPFPLENEYNPGISIAVDSGMTLTPDGQVRMQIANGGSSMSLLMETDTGDRLQRYQNFGYGSMWGGAGPTSPPALVPGGINGSLTRGFRTRFRNVADGGGASPADVRIFADYNWRRLEVRRSPTTSGNFSDNPVQRMVTKTNNSTNATSGFITPLAADTTRAYWGRAYDTTGVESGILYHLPHQGAPFVSVGQLAHADLAPDSDTAAYGLGGGLASPHVPRDTTFTANGYRDASYLLNTAILDRFMISGVPRTGAFDPFTETLASHRFTFLNDFNGIAPTAADLRPTSPAPSGVNGPRAFASRTLMRGAFNVNSTSVEAWKAQLHALRNLPYNGTSANPRFPRTPFQPGAGTTAATVDENQPDAWNGFRSLTDAEITQLANAIVALIRARGAPSLTIGQFVSRPLTATSDATGLRGILQGAIDDAALNATGFPETNHVNTNDTGESTLYPGGPEHAAGPRNTGIPGWLGQHDLVSLLAPILQARSDTFVIRVAGDALDPLTSTAANPVVIARAWCEAVVQRMPDYVDTADHATEDVGTNLTETNRTLGRRFQVISFRWLTPNDI